MTILMLAFLTFVQQSVRTVSYFDIDTSVNIYPIGSPTGYCEPLFTTPGPDWWKQQSNISSYNDLPSLGKPYVYFIHDIFEVHALITRVNQVTS